MSRLTRASLAGATGTVGLDTPSPAAPGRYRRLFRFAVPTLGAPGRVEIAANSVCDLTFAARSFDAMAAGAPERALLSASGLGLVLRLPVARQIARVRLSTSNAGDEVAAFRFDGKAVSGDPVAIATHSGSSGASLDVTDSQLILRRRRAGAYLALSPGDVAAVVVTVQPQAPRVGVGIVESTAGVSYLPPQTSPEGQPIFPAFASWGPSLADALTTAIARFADGLAAPLPDPLQIDLVAEADTPCSVTVSAFDLGYVLERAERPDGAEKAVLRFPGGQRESCQARFNGLGGIEVLGATVRLTAQARAATQATSPAVALPNLDSVATTGLGIALAPGAALAVRRTLASAQVVTGAQIVASATDSGGAETALVLHGENAGLPGAMLGESVGVRLRAGRPQLVATIFETAIALPAGPIWISLRARRGRCVVALVADASARVVTGDGAVWSEAASAAGAGAAIALLATAPNDSESPGVTLTASVADQAVPLAATGVDFVADLGALPGGFPAAPFMFAVHSTAAGPVTVGPLILRYVPAH